MAKTTKVLAGLAAAGGTGALFVKQVVAVDNTNGAMKTEANPVDETTAEQAESAEPAEPAEPTTILHVAHTPYFKPNYTWASAFIVALTGEILASEFFKEDTTPTTVS